MLNIKNIFRKKDKDNRKNKLIGHLTEDLSEEKKFHIDLNEEFTEESATRKAQFNKVHLSFLEIIENTKTFLVPNELFVIEVLEETVTVGILTKKAIFLDIKYLKKYTYEDLHKSYQRIINKEVEFDRTWYESIENIINIVSYDTIYSIPQKVVIIDNNHSDFVKVTTKAGRFKDKKLLDNLIKKEFELSSGYNKEDVYQQITKRPLKEEVEDKSIYVISMVEKEYFDKVNKYFNDSDLTIKRFHSIKSSLYSSFFIQDKNSKMRIHVVENIAYTMEKHRESGFEYQQFNLDIDTTGIELVAYTMDEVIVSGSGEYYENLKEMLANAEVKVRTYNYFKDMNRCIIRLEEGVKLDNSFASVVGIAYHELFKINFSTIRLGVSKNMTIYEIMYNNLNVLPFFILFTVIVFSYGTYIYLEHEYDKLSQKHLGTTKLVNDKKRQQKAIDRFNKNINTTQGKIKKIEDLFANKITSADALILHEIAQKLPDDMIITKIEKNTVQNKLQKDEISVRVTGKCYQEESLLKYIKSLKIKDKKVFLVKLKDSKKLKFDEEGSDQKSIFSQLMQGLSPAENIKAVTGGMQNQMSSVVNTVTNTTQMLNQNKQMGISTMNPEIDEKLKEIQKMNLENKKIYFSDTLNNEFVLEIK